MSDPARQLLEDRALRDAARNLVHSDVSFIRETARTLPARLADRVTGSARGAAEEAAVIADQNRTVLGAGLAAGTLGFAVWLFREPLQRGVVNLRARIRKLAK
jgi:hypothetical protein